MSEYQFYEFQSLDQPLTREQMEELRQASSRAQITPGGFVNVYNYGDFSGDPEALLGKYFDAFLYLANWGTRWLMLRVPGKLLDAKTVAAYGTDDCLSCSRHGDDVIVSLRSEDEERFEWVEGDGWLAALAPIRAQLMRGDHRALYLGWLVAAQGATIDDHKLEPPVPPGLGELDATLGVLADFMCIDIDLIAAAAEQSTPLANASLSTKELADWIADLPPTAKDTLLARLIASDTPHLALELRQQALDAARDGVPSPRAPRRTVASLLERASVLGEARAKKVAAQRARESAKKERAETARRKKHLESIRGREDSLWHEVDRLIETYQPKRYDDAIAILRDLLELAQMRSDPSAFTTRMAALGAKHAKKTSLVKKFRKAKLIG